VLGVQQADPQFPGEFPVWVLLPEATPLAGPVELTVPFGAVHRFFLDLLGLEGLVLRREADGSLTPMPTLRVDAVAGTITAQVDRFGEYVALDSTFFRLLAQRFELVDPAVPVEVVDLGGALLPVASGDGQVQVGRGSVAQFWSSGAADNVLVVHGFNSNPLEFLGAEDLLEQLAVRYENVLALQYPSACGIAENGLALYDLVRARAQAGFGCHVVAHSMGGLVVRYALEQAHLVRGGAPLTDVVPTLVTLGTPHAGTTLADEFTALFVVALPAAEQGYFQGAYDLGTASPFVGSLNGAYVDNPTAYYTVAGDLGLGTDGVVTVVSAVQTLPVYPGEDTLTVTGPLAAHTLLHGRALTLGIVDRLLLWLSP